MSVPLEVIFAGTPAFAAAALQALLDAGITVSLVLTQPDRPAGRGMQLTPSAVKRVAQAHRIAVLQPASLKDDPSTIERLRRTPHQLMVVAAYGLILPRAVLEIAPRGCLNIHASLLPRWRGAAPIQRAIEAGDGSTGICIMRMEEGLDTGPVLLRESLAIDPQDSAGTLHAKLMHAGARAIVDGVQRLDSLVPVPQATAGVTYAAKITRADAVLDFGQDAALLARKLRAFDPFPGCSAAIGGTVLKLWAGESLAPRVSGDLPVSASAPGSAAAVSPEVAPGTILAADATGIVIACGQGALRVTQWQKPGGKRLGAGEFLQGFALRPGARFDS